MYRISVSAITRMFPAFRLRLTWCMISTDGFDRHPPQYPQTAISRAAALIRAAFLFRKQYKRGILPAERVKEGPICMDTYR